MRKKQDRDIEKGYTVQQMVAKLRRLSDCLENDKPFRIQIAGESLNIPSRAILILNMKEKAKQRRLNFNFIESGISSGGFKSSASIR
ncbi:MAG: amphi-Trp domain-containing protein [Desulfobacteraceae bacterium]|jgi:hypothetical protein|nr:amphi-Trp domain-containing protein [Desulfobacteraceae bacterium]